MSESIGPDDWLAADALLDRLLLDEDPALRAALVDSEAAGLPPIEVAPQAGRLLYLLARIGGARRVLEIGTLGGYSTSCLARGVGPDGVPATRCTRSASCLGHLCPNNASRLAIRP